MIGGQCSRLLISSLLCSRVEDTTLADTLTPHSSFLIGPAAVARRARYTHDAVRQTIQPGGRSEIRYRNGKSFHSAVYSDRPSVHRISHSLADHAVLYHVPSVSPQSTQRYSNQTFADHYQTSPSQKLGMRCDVSSIMEGSGQPPHRKPG